MFTNVVMDFCIISGCLLLAKGLRVGIPFFQKLHIPTAVMGGGIGLVLQLCYPGVMSSSIAEYPGVLIAVLFCTMILGRSSDRLGRGEIKRASQSMFVNAATEMSQFGFFILIGVLLLPLLFHGINSAFGLMLPAGFVGGHGTAAAIGSELIRSGWLDATSIGFTFATIGLLGGIGIGVVLINIGIKRGWVQNIKETKEISTAQRKGLISERDREPLAMETIDPTSMDSITWTLCSILICVGLAYFIHNKIFLWQGLSVPVYGLALLCGFIFSKLLTGLGGSSYLDKRLVVHIGSSATDYLIAFGVASINVQVVMNNLLPLLFLIIFGFAFVILWFIVSKKLFDTYWFERSIFIFGISTGVFSTGVLLLRIVDPQFKTGVLIDFGLAWIVLSIVDLLLVTFSPLIVIHGWGVEYGLILCFVSLLLVVFSKYSNFFKNIFWK